MPERFLRIFHELSASVDFVTAFKGLLDEFLRGNIADPERVAESAAIDQHLGEISRAWDDIFEPDTSRRPAAVATITLEAIRKSFDVP